MLTFPLEGIASIAMLVMMASMSIWGIVSRHFRDNLPQRIGMCIVAVACLLAIPPRIANPSAVPHLLLAMSGLLSFAIGTAWKIAKHRTEQPNLPKSRPIGWLIGSAFLGPLLWLGIPAVTGGAEVAGREGDYVLVKMWGSRIRGDECIYRGVVAYAEGPNRIRDHININRIDRVADGRQLPPGHYNFGIWKAGPLPEDAERLIIRIDHTCGGMAVTARIAALPIANLQ